MHRLYRRRWHLRSRHNLTLDRREASMNLIGRLKTAAKSALCALYKYSGAAAWQERRQRAAGRSAAVILLFHRVTDEIPEDGLTVGVRRFGRICRMLRRQFHVVPVGEIVRRVRAGEPLPPRTLAITFDDSYHCNLIAARVLAEHCLPACFFIPTGYVGTDQVYPWDQDLPCRLGHLNWDEVRQLAAWNFEIGSHTVTHPDLGQVSEEQVRRELIDSRQALEDQLGRRVRWFAYPFGGQEHFRPERLRLVEEAGYEACFSAHGGFITRDRSDSILPREPVPYFHSVIHLELYLRGTLHWFYAWKRQRLAEAPLADWRARSP